MSGEQARARMREEVARFESELYALAWDLVHTVLSSELARRTPTPRAAPAAPAAPASRGPGRIARWSREAIVEELVTWMISGTTVDAAFLTRHGPPGLVAAARRTFGRFEAALNVAAIQVAARYPEGAAKPMSPLLRSRPREPAAAESSPPAAEVAPAVEAAPDPAAATG